MRPERDRLKYRQKEKPFLPIQPFLQLLPRLSDPAHNPRDAVDRDLRAVRNASRRVGNAEHHGHSSLPPE